MLGRLRLPALVGSYHEQTDGYPPGPRQHVLYESFVARYVDQTDLVAGRQRQPRESQIDGQPPPLLLLEAVGIDTGQTLNESGLAVIDVARGSDDMHASRLEPLVRAASP